MTSKTLRTRVEFGLTDELVNFIRLCCPKIKTTERIDLYANPESCKIPFHRLEEMVIALEK